MSGGAALIQISFLGFIYVSVSNFTENIIFVMFWPLPASACSQLASCLVLAQTDDLTMAVVDQ